MIDRSHALPLAAQARELGISRGAIDYEPVPTSKNDLMLMRRIDELHLDFPFAGSRMMRGRLKEESFAVGCRHVATLMKRMGIEALYRKRNTSKPAPDTRSTRIFCAGRRSTNPIGSGRWTSPTFRCGVASCTSPPSSPFDRLKRFSRKVLAWRLSITLHADSRVEALKEALARFGKSEIMNTDQGSQFTSADFIAVLTAHDIRISMDGKGAWRDNVFVERLWRKINTRRSTSKPTTALPRPAPRSAAI